MQTTNKITNKIPRQARVSAKGSWKKQLRAAEATQLIVLLVLVFGTKACTYLLARHLLHLLRQCLLE